MKKLVLQPWLFNVVMFRPDWNTCRYLVRHMFQLLWMHEKETNYILREAAKEYSKLYIQANLLRQSFKCVVETFIECESQEKLLTVHEESE